MPLGSRNDRHVRKCNCRAAKRNLAIYHNYFKRKTLRVLVRGLPRWAGGLCSGHIPHLLFFATPVEFVPSPTPFSRLPDIAALQRRVATNFLVWFVRADV
jgi:hypothetical protein